FEQVLREVDAEHRSLRPDGLYRGDRGGAAAAADVEHAIAGPQAEPVDGTTPEASPERVRGIVVGVRGRIVRGRRPRLRLFELRHVPRSTSAAARGQALGR